MEELIKYLENELKKIDIKTSTDDLKVFVSDMYKKISFVCTVTGNEEEIKTNMLNFLLQYQYGTLKKEDFFMNAFDCTGNVYDPISRTVTPKKMYTYTPNPGNPRKNSSKKVVDIYPDFILELIQKYDKVDGIIDEIKTSLSTMRAGQSNLKNALGDYALINEKLELIKEKILQVGSKFIDVDNNITSDIEKLNVTIEQVITAATYYKATGKQIKYGYLSNGFSMSEVKKEDIGNYLNNNGWKKDGNFYVSKDGNYKYNFVNGKVYSDGKAIQCGFYKTGTTNLGSINNTITLLSGSGSSKDFNIDSMKLSNGSLVVVPEYTALGGITTREHNKQIVACTKVGDFLSSSSNPDDIYNSLVGYSLGSQTGTYTIANNPGVYKTFVSVNGNTKSYNNGGYDFIGGKYDSFKGVNVIYIQSKNNDTCKLINGNVEAATEIANHGGNVLLLTNGEKPKGWNLPCETFKDDKFIGHKDGNVAIGNILTSLSSTK